jgi:hypothetical protein
LQGQSLPTPPRGTHDREERSRLRKECSWFSIASRFPVNQALPPKRIFTAMFFLDKGVPDLMLPKSFL